MKVLIAHNRYRSELPSGENSVVDAEIELLGDAGVKVVPFLTSSDSLARMSLRTRIEAGLGPVIAPTGVPRFAAALRASRPDIVHLHNPFPLISPWIIRVASDAGVPVVQTVHNYRHSCVGGLHFRDGKTCTSCVGLRVALPAVTHGCYRDSKAQTAAMVFGQAVHRPTWRKVSRFIALTPFMAGRLTEQGVDEGRIVVRPTWVPDPGPPTSPGTGVLFLGRLEPAKGVELLLQTWQQESVAAAGPRLLIAGDGPLRSAVEAAARTNPLIEYLGRIPPGEAASAIRAAACVIVPSLWFEGYPLVIAEALAHGRAVICAAGGSAASAVGSEFGWVVTPRVSEMARLISTLDRGDLAIKGERARAVYESHNSPRAATESLITVYSRVVEESR